MPISKLKQLNCAYGAPMGRGSATREQSLKWLREDIDSMQSALTIWEREGAYRHGIYSLSANDVRIRATDYREQIHALTKQIERIEASKDSNKFYLAKLPIDSGGYDSGGAYFGTPNTVYRYESVDGATYGTLRAQSRSDARQQVGELYVGATFFH